jgi:hypothetical protein
MLKRTSPMQKMLRAKCLWGLHMVSLSGNASIRAFALVQVRARKAQGLYD